LTIKHFPGERKYLLSCVMVAGSLLGQVACGRNSAPTRTALEATGTSSQRIASVTRQLTDTRPLPSTVLDANYLDEQTGDGVFGPSDHVSFAMVQIAPQNLNRWTTDLRPLPVPPAYAAPSQNRSWWPTRQAFPRLAFFQPAPPLAETTHGWIAVSRDSGCIYAFSFSM
jgi:hypothetical protein